MIAIIHDTRLSYIKKFFGKFFKPTELRQERHAFGTKDEDANSPAESHDGHRSFPPREPLPPPEGAERGLFQKKSKSEAKSIDKSPPFRYNE